MKISIEEIGLMRVSAYRMFNVKIIRKGEGLVAGREGG
jgi:hypothetical protein